LRRSRSNWRQAGLDALGVAAVGHGHQQSLTRVLPVMRRCSVLIGMQHQVVLVVAEGALALGAEHGR
jgi:hypothetical protein